MHWIQGRENLHPWKPDVRQTGTERVLEIRGLSVGVAAPRAYHRGDFLLGRPWERMPGRGVRLWESPQRSCYPSCVYSHAVTVPRGPGTLEGLGSSDLIRSSHTDDRDMQSSFAEGPSEATGGRDFTATGFPVGWTLPRSSSLMVKGGRLDPSDRWGV